MYDVGVENFRLPGKREADYATFYDCLRGLYIVVMCRGVGRSAKLKEQVTTIDFQARSVAALLHHPFRPIMVGVDGRGTVKVYNHRHSTFVNSFHLADDKWPMSVVNMWQLNELKQHSSVSFPPT